MNKSGKGQTRADIRYQEEQKSKDKRKKPQANKCKARACPQKGHALLMSKAKSGRLIETVP